LGIESGIFIIYNPFITVISLWQFEVTNSNNPTHCGKYFDTRE